MSFDPYKEKTIIKNYIKGIARFDQSTSRLYSAGEVYHTPLHNITLLHYGSFTSVVGSESRQSSGGIFVT